MFELSEHIVLLLLLFLLLGKFIHRSEIFNRLNRRRWKRSSELLLSSRDLICKIVTLRDGFRDVTVTVLQLLIHLLWRDLKTKTVIVTVMYNTLHTAFNRRLPALDQFKRFKRLYCRVLTANRMNLRSDMYGWPSS